MLDSWGCRAYMTGVRNRVRELREQKQINQSEFARLCEVSRQAIHAIETGQFKPSVTLAMKIAGALGKRVEDIFVLEKGD